MLLKLPGGMLAVGIIDEADLVRRDVDAESHRHAATAILLVPLSSTRFWDEVR